MIRNPLYSLNELYSEKYLLPYGQAVVDHLPPVAVNEVTAFLWDFYAISHTAKEGIDAVSQHFAISAEELPNVQKELSETLGEFEQRRFLIKEETGTAGESLCNSLSCALPFESAPLPYRIAGKDLLFHLPPDYLSEAWAPYRVPATSGNALHIRYEIGDFESTSEAAILNSPDMIVSGTGSEYSIQYPTFRHISGLTYRPDSQEVLFTLRDDDISPEVQEEIFLALRFPFLQECMSAEILAIHSASFLYQDRVYLISAKSGTGKSTHISLWEQEYGVQPINGDLNLLSLNPDGKAIVLGSPWCGTSKITTAATYPLGGILFLSRANDDTVSPLSADKALLNLMSRNIICSLTESELKKNLQTAGRILDSGILTGSLRCTATPHAAKVAREYIDRYGFLHEI